MAKKNQKFRLFTTPRYLIGSVAKDILETDLEEYNTHRFKVFTAKPRIDTKPLRMNPRKYIDYRKLNADANRLAQIDIDNQKLLKKINIIYRTTGRVDTYNPNAYENPTRWRSHEKRMKEIQKKNYAFYKKITSTKSTYNRQIMNEFWSEKVDNIKRRCLYKLIILKKTNQDESIARCVSISEHLDKTNLGIIQRPLCFLEFSVKDGQYLGRVIVELYEDIAPLTVQNFLQICNPTNKLTYKNCLVHRIVPGDFLQTGDITEGTGRGGFSIYGKTFKEEKKILKHTKPGVLSMVRVGKQENNSQFCITFAKKESLDKQYVVFGKIIKGIENLFKVEGYGRDIGKPLDKIIISNCGQI